VLSLFALLSCAGYGLFSYVRAQRAAQTEVTFHDSPFPSIEKPETILVHVAGQVKKPGVYELKPGARVRDAVTAAQGASKEADVHALNLAAFLRDGEKVWVPHRQEQSARLMADNRPPKSSASSARSSQKPSAPSSAKPSGEWLKRHKINLNKATSEQLQQLPGIGPTLADRILQYRREQGRFQSVEDLMNVTGIGQKRFEQLRELIAV
jgi:competence protein ComEA